MKTSSMCGKRDLYIRQDGRKKKKKGRGAFIISEEEE